MNEFTKNIENIQNKLNIQLPRSFKDYLKSDNASLVFGLPILGVQDNYHVDSMLGATMALRLNRPNLSQYAVIRLLDDRALCLDIGNGSEFDSPLVEVNLNNSNIPPKQVHSSFESYINDHERTARRVNGALKRIKGHMDRGHSSRYEHSGFNKPGSKPRYWRVMRSCVHDQVVGLTAIRHNENFNGLEVDVFICTDHPDYEPGHGVKALMMLLFSDAYRNGGTMEIRFTRYDHKSQTRVSDKIPIELSRLYSQLTLKIEKAYEGIIAHDEALSLFASIVGINSEAMTKIDHYYQLGRDITLQGVCYLLASRLWTAEEATWILINCHRPEAVLFGSDMPEKWFNYQEALSYGRTAVAGTKLYEKLSLFHNGSDGACSVKIDNKFWQFTPSQDVTLDWLPNGDSVHIKANSSITIFPRPRHPLINEKDKLVEDAKCLVEQPGRKFLLYSTDMSKLNYLEKLQVALNKHDMGILLLPFSCRELDDILEQKMSRARVLRK
jgi:hypothetical protein